MDETQYFNVVGGPKPWTFRLIDPRTGEEVPGVKRITIDLQPGRFAEAEVTLIVGVDVNLRLQDITVKADATQILMETL